MLRLLPPTLTLAASCAFLALAKWIYDYRAVPAYNPDHTPRVFNDVLILLIGGPALLGALVSLLALHLRLRALRQRRG